MNEVVRDVGYQAACVTAFGQGWQSFGVRTSLIPILVVDSLHADASWTGIAFAIAAVAQTLVLVPVGRATDTLGRRPVMIAAGLITARHICQRCDQRTQGYPGDGCRSLCCSPGGFGQSGGGPGFAG